MTDSFAHGPFRVSAEGRMAPLDADHRAPRLRFSWRGRECEVQWKKDGLHLAAAAGRVPFTIEVGLARAEVLAAVAKLPEELPEGWNIALTPDSRLRLRAVAPTADGTVGLLAALVRFALALDPCLERLGGLAAENEAAAG